ncbi:hypothetical protein CKQ16_21920 [Salmonella enterica subsp. enterica serovar Newport]|nr:hypothetical protein [Salmonella enterica subsp. enterica serovar Newport]
MLLIEFSGSNDIPDEYAVLKYTGKMRERVRCYITDKPGPEPKTEITFYKIISICRVTGLLLCGTG